MSTDERMKKMEGQLARVRWFNRCLIACIVLSLGVWFISKTFGPKTAWAGSGVKVIRANRFVLEDENGKTRAALGMSKAGPALSLWDENDNPRATLSMFKGEPRLTLFDENGKFSVVLKADKEGSSLALWDENGKPRTVLGQVKDRGAALVITGADGKVIWGAP